jgi:nitrate/nitrite transport system permease protein
MKFLQSLKLDFILLPLVGILLCIGGWAIISGKSTTTTSVDDWGDPVTKVERQGISKNLPSPSETWTASKPYIAEPFAKRG